VCVCVCVCVCVFVCECVCVFVVVTCWSARCRWHSDSPALVVWTHFVWTTSVNINVRSSVE